MDSVDRRFLDAAQECLASAGLRGFSLRAVAQGAGGSLGSLNYRFGGKAALIERLVDRERAERRDLHARWREMLSPIDLSVPRVLGDVISAYIDAALHRRTAALATSELLVGASLAPEDYPGVPALLEEEVSFWQGVLESRIGPLAKVFGRAIAGYVRDELPFAIACAGVAGYRLLRAATTERIAQGLAAGPAMLALHFDHLVAICGAATAPTDVPLAIPAESRKAELAGHIAMLIVEQGLGAVTHRMVALRAGVPNSTVAHHFRTHEDLLYAGIAGLALAMRGEIASSEGRNKDQRFGLAMIRATHMAALAAARDPALVLFALDMRRRRAENVRAALGAEIGLDPEADGAGIQAAVMVLIGCGFMSLASGSAATSPELGAAELNALRRSRLGDSIART